MKRKKILFVVIILLLLVAATIIVIVVRTAKHSNEVTENQMNKEQFETTDETEDVDSESVPLTFSLQEGIDRTYFVDPFNEIKELNLSDETVEKLRKEIGTYEYKTIKNWSPWYAISVASDIVPENGYKIVYLSSNYDAGYELKVFDNSQKYECKPITQDALNDALGKYGNYPDPDEAFENAYSSSAE